MDSRYSALSGYTTVIVRVACIERTGRSMTCDAFVVVCLKDCYVGPPNTSFAVFILHGWRGKRAPTLVSTSGT